MRSWLVRIPALSLALALIAGSGASAAAWAAEQGEPSSEADLPGAKLLSVLEVNGSLSTMRNLAAGEVVPVRFAVYSKEDGGEPVWNETQDVVLGTDGDYHVLLGSTSPAGLPSDLFSPGTSSWLAVEPLSGAAEPLPRILIATIAAPSEKEPTDSAAASDGRVGEPSRVEPATPAKKKRRRYGARYGGAPTSSRVSATRAQSAPAASSKVATQQAAATESGVPNSIAKFVDANTLGSSVAFENANGISINSDGSQYPGSALYVMGDGSNREVMIVDAPANQVTDLQTWRVNGRVVADITSTGLAELAGISFQRSLGGGNGYIAEHANGSMAFVTGPLSNGNLVFDASATGKLHFLYGDTARQTLDANGLTFDNADVIAFKDTSGIPRNAVRGAVDNTLALGSLGNGVRIMARDFTRDLLNVSESGKVKISGGVADGGGFKHRRVATPVLSAGATSPVPVSWASAFVDTSYTVSCSVAAAASGAGLTVSRIDSTTASGVTVLVKNEDATASHNGVLNCIGIHD
ncbi:MAG: hypothetical protein QOD06_2419 [Candidatus Binatota bacterium]|nr:hypothetical protein [Candidatus Binatota bacterium]